MKLTLHTARVSQFATLLVGLAVAGCAASPTALHGVRSIDGASPGSGTSRETRAPVAGSPAGGVGAPVSEPVPATIGVPYRPDVQFTPLYVAQARHYYRDRGYEVTLQYGDESNLLRLLAGGKLEAVVASGEQVILARGQGVPVTYVMAWYQRFPGVVFSMDPDLDSPADLVGRKVGLPSAQGASYTGWLALLAANDLDPRAVRTEIIGYRQLDAVLQGQVDAAVGYGTNEPVQLAAPGQKATVIEIAASFNLVSNGLVVAEQSIVETPSLVEALVTGTLEGIRDTVADPDSAFGVALQVVPEAGDPEVRETQMQVLLASIPYWKADPFGRIEPELWRQSRDLMVAEDLVESPTAIEDMIDPRFVDAANVRQ